MCILFDARFLSFINRIPFKNVLWDTSFLTHIYSLSIPILHSHIQGIALVNYMKEELNAFLQYT